MKKIIPLILMLFSKNGFSQSIPVIEKTIEKSVVETVFDAHNILLSENIDIGNYSNVLAKKSNNDTIKSKLSFHDFLITHPTIIKNQSNQFKNELIFDTVLNNIEKIKTYVLPISVTPCYYKDGNSYYENAYCIKIKEIQNYIYEDDIKLIKTQYNYYWYTEVFTNYLASYIQSIDHTLLDIAINYSENYSKNSISLLEKKYLNELYKSIQVYPNPVTTGLFNLSFTTHEEKTITIDLFDNIGSRIKSFEIHTKKGNNSYPIEVGRIIDGFYSIKFNIDNEIFTKKFIIEYE